MGRLISRECQLRVSNDIWDVCVSEIVNMGIHSGKIKAAGNIVVEGYLVAQ